MDRKCICIQNVRYCNNISLGDFFFSDRPAPVLITFIKILFFSGLIHYQTSKYIFIQLDHYQVIKAIIMRFQ